MNSSNIITIVVVTLILIGGGYWYFSSQSGTQAPLTAATTAGGGNAAQTQFQTLVSELSPISFNTDIFSDPRFTSLIDLKTPIAPEVSGRNDPFAPIPGVTGQ